MLTIILIWSLLLNPVDRYLIEYQEELNEIDPVLILALAHIETGGNGFQNDRMVIRLENHVLVAKCPLASSTFVYNPSEHWKDHYYKNSLSNEWHFTHNNQNSEYDALSVAKFLCGDSAYESVSMGMFQIMGIHYKKLGFPSAELMYSFMSESPERQIQVFNIMISKNSALRRAFQEYDYQTIQTIWNSGQKDFADKLHSTYLSMKSP